jgi:DNA-binding winged helix-turn-helix (wHTH) protein
MLYSFGDFELDTPRFELRNRGAKVAIQPKVLDLLCYLVRARDRVVSRQELMGSVWGDATVSDASIGHAVMEARRAIGDDLQKVIVTVRARGFRFAGEVIEKAARPDPPAPEPASDPLFVGREAALSAAGVRLQEALKGRGSIVWLTGEAGIGKTRLAEEILRRAESQGASIVRARAHEERGTPALWIWARVVRELGAVRSDAPVRDLYERIVPRLSGEPPGSSAEQFALHEDLVRFLARLSRARPLLIVLDDLHWADEASLQLLQFLSRALRELALLVVCTYRDALLKGDGRARTLGALLAESSSLSVPLRGLSEREIERLVEVLSGTPPGERLVKALAERSGGNPLYVRELLKTEWAEHALRTKAQELASTMDLQQGLIESIASHLDALSAGARELLGLAAVLGREFETAKLRVVSGLSPDDLLNWLEEAKRAGLLTSSKRGTHRFAHLLVRDALYKKVAAAQRAALHAMVADKLGAHYGEAAPAHAGELADHLSRALPGGDATQALRMAVTAAEQATERGLHREAARHWQQAANALDLVPHDGQRAVSVHLGLARSRAALGEIGAALQSFFDAALLARTFARPLALAEAALGVAGLPSGPGERLALLLEARSGLETAQNEDAEGLRARIEAALSP